MYHRSNSGVYWFPQIKIDFKLDINRAFQLNKFNVVYVELKLDTCEFVLLLNTYCLTSHTYCFTHVSFFADIEDKSESISEKDKESVDLKQKDETEISIPAVISTSSLDNEGRSLTLAQD